MSVLVFDDVDNEVRFSPLSSALGSLMNGAGTIVLLARLGGRGGLFSVEDSGHVNINPGFSIDGSNKLNEDDNAALSTATTAVGTSTAGAGNYRVVALDWASGAASLSRFHWSTVLSGAQTFTHDPAAANNGGTHAGPGTSGHLRIGTGTTEGTFLGEIALAAAWTQRFADGDYAALLTNDRTSDWWNHPVGQPITLIELNTLTPVDIGSAPSTLNTVVGGTLTGADPSPWTFDGRGAVPVPVVEMGYTKFPKSILRGGVVP